MKLQPYRQKSLAHRPFEKLAARFYGPFTIIQKIGEVAYKLELPTHSKIHPVFHVSQLQKAVGNAQVSATIPEQITADLEWVAEPEEVPEVKTVGKGPGCTTEVLIKWRNVPLFEATWEEFNSVLQRFSEFHLEDKVRFWAGGNVMPDSRPFSKLVYTRRGKKGQNG